VVFSVKEHEPLDPQDVKMSHVALNFLWNGLSADTRAGYNSAVKSYEYLYPS